MNHIIEDRIELIYLKLEKIPSLKVIVRFSHRNRKLVLHRFVIRNKSILKTLKFHRRQLPLLFFTLIANMPTRRNHLPKNRPTKIISAIPSTHRFYLAFPTVVQPLICLRCDAYAMLRLLFVRNNNKQSNNVAVGLVGRIALNPQFNGNLFAELGHRLCLCATRALFVFAISIAEKFDVSENN